LGGSLHAANSTEAKALSPDEELKVAQAGPGLKVELVAAEPLIASPCALAFDDRGRLYVAENRGYPIGPKEGEPGSGKIALLEDTNGDGRMDKRTDFAEGLGFPNGVMPWKDGVIVTSSPDIYFMQDTDGDGRADVKRVLLTGFETAKSTQLRVNRPLLGPDGWIYFAAGLSGGTITSPEHPEFPPLKMTSDIRWNPETGEYQAVDGKSQYGQSFDAAGQRFICMNRVQVQHVALPSRYLKRNPLLPFSDSVQNCPELVPNMLMHSTGGAARLYPISSNITTADSHVGTFSAACAIFIWPGGALPQEYVGCAISCDPTGNLVHVDKLVPKGGSYAAEPLLQKRELLAFRDDWARPVFVETGPDGALYVCDMYRKTIEHPDYLSQEIRKHTDFESGKTMGRIWRVKASDETAPLDSVPWASRRIFRHAVEKSVPVNADDLKLSLSTIANLSGPAKKGDADADKGKRFFGMLMESVQAQSFATFDLNLLAIAGALEKEDLEAAFRTKRADTTRRALELSEGNPEFQAIARQHLDTELMKDGRLRFQAALSIDDLDLAHLAQILVLSDGDRWTDAAVLSAVPKRALALLEEVQTQQPGFSSPALQLAGKLIGSGKETPDATALVEKLDKLKAGLPAVVAGFCEASKAKLDPANPTLKKLLDEAQAQLAKADPAKPPLDAVTLLSFAPWEVAREPLFHAATPKSSAELEQAAIRALAGFSEPEVTKTLLQKDRWKAATPQEREAILTSLLARPAHHSGILSAIENDEIPASAIPTLRRAALLKGKEKERAEKLFASAVGDRQKAFEAAKAALELTPTPEHGHEVFKAICSTCHRLNQEGYAVGPDLFDIRNQPKENILFHITIPDAEIAPAFTTYTLETKDGRTLLGLLASETANSVTLRMPLAQEETVLRTNIANLNAMPNSLMPTGLDAALSKQDLADLLAYLRGER
jgi:putative membrane-bound dehydrogenase-like protein